MVTDREIKQDGFTYVPNIGVWYKGERLRIPPSEQRILGALLANPGRVLTKEGLVAYVGTEAEARIVEVWVCKLRKVLGKLLRFQPIVTVWGRGLMWSIPPT